MEGLYPKPIRLILPTLNDKFIRNKSSKSFEAFGEIISIQEDIKMLLKLRVIPIVIAFYSSFFQGAVHTSYLTICSRMINFGKSMFDLMFMAYLIKDMSECPVVLLAIRKLYTVIGENGVNVVRNGSNQIA